jgi:xylulokinase
VFGLPVEVPLQAEGAAFGAALQALWAHERARGAHTDLAVLAREHVLMAPGLSARPDSRSVSAYQSHYGQFLRHLGAAKSFYANPSSTSAV